MRFICTDCGNQASFADDVVGLCTCGFPLEVHYDWEDSKQHRNIDHDDQSLWRYSAVLPQVSKSNRITLGEGFTTLSQAENGWGIDLYIKDETGNPTGSFKDRGMALAVSMAKEQGVQAICLPSAGMRELPPPPIAEKQESNPMYFFRKRYLIHICIRLNVMLQMYICRETLLPMLESICWIINRMAGLIFPH